MGGIGCKGGSGKWEKEKKHYYKKSPVIPDFNFHDIYKNITGTESISNQNLMRHMLNKLTCG